MARFSPNLMANYLTCCARYNPDGEVIVHGERRISWGRLKTRAFKLANALLALGIHKNDKVALVFHNTPEFVEANYAIQVAGAVPVPVNYRFTAMEFERQIRHSDADIVIYHARWHQAVEEALSRLDGQRLFMCAGPSDLAGAWDYEAVIAAGGEVDPEVPTAEDDVAAIIYTGGTTGFPKGVMLTYGAHLEMFANLFVNLVMESTHLDLTEEQVRRLAENFPIPALDYLLPIVRTRLFRQVVQHPISSAVLKRTLRLLLTHPEVARFGYGNTVGYIVPSLPFFHDASYQLLMLGAMVGNLCYVLPSGERFAAARVLQTIEREKPSLMANVPTGWKRLVSHPDIDRYDVSSVTAAVTGGGVCPLSLKQKIFDKFPGIIIIDMFGQTEMTPLTAFRIDTSAHTLKERSVGKPIVEVRIVDEQGAPVPDGQVGEIMYRSSTVMKGYYKDEQATRDATRGGWLRSGDLGYMDEEGELRVVDRKGECINIGGEKVFPLEVEEILAKHPAVEMACIIGVEDAEWGHVVRAVVQRKSGSEVTAEEIIRHCRRRLAGYKVPRSVVFVRELPLSPVGKVLRSKIRELYGT